MAFATQTGSVYDSYYELELLAGRAHSNYQRSKGLQNQNYLSGWSESFLTQSFLW